MLVVIIPFCSSHEIRFGFVQSDAPVNYIFLAISPRNHPEEISYATIDDPSDVLYLRPSLGLHCIIEYS